jgi:serine/threonine-protein kinase
MSERASSQIDAVQTQGQRYDPLIGQTLDGRYKIERVLGEGGMGIVYKAVHTTLGKPLAIKVLRPEVSKNEEIVQRFRQEAQSASQIGNPHIIDISDFGTLADGSTYFVMEFLTGKSLTAAQADGKFSLARTIHVVRQLAGALGAAHDIGIVHRDLKPDNVQLVERGGQKDFVKVLDFGIAKVGGSTSKLTQAGQVFGTPHYMSPEQCAGTNVDQRTDIYAVGVMLYEMACNKVPFDADNLMGILTKHLYENPIAPHELAPAVDVPPALEAVILKCLQKKPEARYQTMAELSADLDAIERGQAPRAVIDKVERATSGPQTLTGVEARVSIASGLQDIAIRKSRAPLFVGAGFGAVLVIGVIVGTMSKQASSAPQTEAAKPAAPPTSEPAPAQPTAAAANPAPAAPDPAPVKAPPPEVKVTVASNPDSAEVYLDGSLLGNTPCPVVKPSADKPALKLELRLNGYENKSVIISARSNDVAVTLKKLEDKPAAHPTPAKPAKRPRTESGAHQEKPSHSGGSQTEVLDPWN